MAIRNGSYASRVDRMRTASTSEKGNSKPSKGLPSPSSSKPAFSSTDKAKTIARKAQRSKASFAPSPERGPQPRGMGERSVNWSAHIRRANAMQAEIDGPRRAATRPTAEMAQKAKEAAQKHSAASKALKNDRSMER